MTNGNIEQKIISTARELFIEKGYVETNMSDIAAAVGMRRTALHYYFRTKDRLFQAIYGDIVRSMIARIHDIIASDMPILERLSTIIDEYTGLFMRNPVLPQFVIGEIRRDVDNLIRVAKEMGIEEDVEDIKSIMMDEIRKGTIRNVPPHIVFFTFISQITFPFLTKNLVVRILPQGSDGTGDFDAFTAEWKRSLLIQMGCLLSCDGDRNAVTEQVDRLLSESRDAKSR